MKDLRYVLLLVLAGLVLFVFGLGAMPLTDPDETFYAETAREMLEQGDWATPVIFGQPQFEKPPLYYWLVISSYRAFGISEFSSRLPSAVFALAGILGIFFLARIFYGPAASFLAAFMTATSVGYLAMARACVTDMVLCVLILYCLLFFVKGWNSRTRTYFYASSIMAALAVLTKGPIGLLIPGLIFLLYIALAREWSGLRHVPVLSCVALFLAIAAPWYFLVYMRHGQAFISEFIGKHNVTRFLVPEHKTGSSPFFNVPVVLGGFYPWSFFLVQSAWKMFKQKWPSKSQINPRILLAVWFFSVFIFFSLSSTKLVTYIFPLFPVLGVVVARFWHKAGERTGNGSEKLLTISYWIFAALSLFALPAVYFFGIREYPSAGPGIIMSSSVFAAGIAVSLVFMRRRKIIKAGYVIFTAMTLMSVPLSIRVLPAIGAAESSRSLAVTAARLSRPGDAFAGEDDHRRGVAFYARREKIWDVQNDLARMEFFLRDQRVWVIARKEKLRQTQKRLSPENKIFIIATAGEKALATNKPLAGRTPADNE